MRQVETMVVLFVAAALSGFFFQLGGKEATADPLVPCERQSCVVVEAWYAGPDGPLPVNLSAEVQDFDPNMPVHLDTAWPAFFDSATTGTTPLVAIGQFEQWKWLSASQQPNDQSARLYRQT